MKRILIVDDDKDLAEVIAQGLQAEDTKIYVRDNGADALSLVSKMELDLVILDLVIPNMSGIEMASRLKVAGRGYIPVIFISGSPTLGGVVSRKHDDTHYFLSKPFNLAELRRVVHQFFETGTLRTVQPQTVKEVV